MKIALVQQTAGADRADNVRRGLAALQQAASAGAALVCYAELQFLTNQTTGNHHK